MTVLICPPGLSEYTPRNVLYSEKEDLEWEAVRQIKLYTVICATSRRGRNITSQIH